MKLATKSAACNALHAFLPNAGREYAARRNYDFGPDKEASVSGLSPWIRIRLLPEWEVVSAVLKRHDRSEASKFIDEVCWRTYWKGWLQLRPSVWVDYLRDRSALIEDYRDHRGYQRAMEGRTGIECFDYWNQELLANNYLHNHARMWYASIWIHTLKLPWQLGADWFLRHLLDGDPASNTLSWRWVAGLHTPGKTYLARPENIRKYTNQGFQVTETLATEAREPGEDARPRAKPLPERAHVPADQKLGLLVTEEDLSAADWLPEQYSFACTAKCFPLESYKALDIRPEVVDFRREALKQVNGSEIVEKPRQLVEWAKQENLDALVTAEPTVGHWPETLTALRSALGAEKIGLYTVRHWWEQTLFPHADKGFFKFRKAIPEALDRLDI